MADFHGITDALAAHTLVLTNGNTAAGNLSVPVNKVYTSMGFGSYDESEQENQEIDASDIEDEGLDTADHNHEGEVEFEFGDTTNDDLLEQLEDIKGT